MEIPFFCEINDHFYGLNTNNETQQNLTIYTKKVLKFKKIIKWKR